MCISYIFFLRQVRALEQLAFSWGFLYIYAMRLSLWFWDSAMLQLGVDLLSHVFKLHLTLHLCNCPFSFSFSWFLVLVPTTLQPQSNSCGPDSDLYKRTGGISLWPHTPSLMPSFRPHRLEGQTVLFTAALSTLQVLQRGHTSRAD